jgi:hypothetical protein
MNTVALLLSASIALACICVLGGSTPFARRVMMDLGRLRSCGFCGLAQKSFECAPSLLSTPNSHNWITL